MGSKNTPQSDTSTRRLGTLYLVPTPLDFGCAPNGSLDQVLPEHSLRVAASIGHWICENAKSARAFLNRVADSRPLCMPLQSMHWQVLPHQVHKKGDHQGQFDAKTMLHPALGGFDMGLISEAGMPAIADPGASVVRAAHACGVCVIPLVGPVSLMLALAASGLNGQNFAFVGYLSTDPELRQARLRMLESLSRTTGQTQLFIETPYRNEALLRTLLQTLQPDTRLLYASGLTLENALCHCDTVKQWRQRQWASSTALPAVFGIGGP